MLMTGIETVFLKHCVGGRVDFKTHKHINPKHALTHPQATESWLFGDQLKSQ